MYTYLNLLLRQVPTSPLDVSQSTDIEALCAVWHKFEAYQRRADMVRRSVRAPDARPSLAKLARVQDALTQRQHELICKIVALPARSQAEVEAKAEVWRAYSVDLLDTQEVAPQEDIPASIACDMAALRVA